MDVPIKNIEFPIKLRISAGAVVIKHEKTEAFVLCVRRTFDGGFQDLSLPKGGIELAESLQESATREVKEETGYHISLRRFLGSKEYFYVSEKEKVNFLFRTYWFAGDLKSKDQEPFWEHEIDEVVWIPVEEAVKTLSYEDHKNILKMCI